VFPLPQEQTIKKEITEKKDGRYLIFYSWAEEELHGEKESGSEPCQS
jgi:hypothetical protein